MVYLKVNTDLIFSRIMILRLCISTSEFLISKIMQTKSQALTLRSVVYIFARIFYRNSINIGLPIWECPEAAAGIAAGDEVRADLDEGTITDVTTGKTFKARPFPPFIQNIIEAGGLINSLKK